MKWFVAGATGVVGRRAVAALVKGGHDVTGVARSDERAATLSALGAVPVILDVFDSTEMRRVVEGHEVVCNLATHIPPISRAALPRAWAENDRIRREVSRNLVDAALATGATRYVQESIAFMYEDRGDLWIDEDVPLDPPTRGRAVVEAEAQVHRFTEGGGAGVVLRFGQFYAADASHSLAMVSLVRKRLPALPGPPGAYSPPIHGDDAGAAVAAAAQVTAGFYNVVDDEPVTREEYNRVVAASVGAKPPLLTGAAALKVGGEAGRFYGRSQRVGNARFRQAAGWAPRYPSVREGWPAVAAEMSAGPDG